MINVKIKVCLSVLAITFFASCATEEGPASPVINNVVPPQGYEGDVIKIEGANFSAQATDNLVKVNGLFATVKSATTTSLEFIVPVNATTGKIEVTTKDLIAVSAADFVIITNPTPTITTLTPSSAITGSTVEIAGQYFTADKSAIKVLFTNAGTTSAEVVSSTPTLISVRVPDDALSGPLTVTVRGISATSPNFSVTPSITDFTPKTGTSGDLITITGTGFTSTSTISFANETSGSPVLAQILSQTNKQAIVTVPPAAATGKIFAGALPTTSDFTIKSNWTTKSAFPGGHLAYVSFAMNSKVYFGLGYGVNTGTKYKDLFEYDPAGDAWVQKANFPGAATAAMVSFSIGGKGYVGLGNSDELWEYDPASDSWTLKAHFPSGGIRLYPAFFVIGESVYITAGTTSISSPSTSFKDTWKYTPATNTWEQKADLPETGGWGYAGMSINGKGYVVNLLNGGSAALYEYNPTLNSWTRKKDIPLNTTGGSFLYDGGIPQFTTSTEGFVFYDRQYFKYLPQYDSWVKLKTYDLQLFCGSMVNGKGYFFNYFDSNLAKVVVFAP